MLLRGALRRERGDLRTALKDLLAAESIARAVHDEVLAAEATTELGRTVLAAGEVEAAREHFDRAARAFARHGARSREADALVWLGGATGARGDPSAARALCERALALVADDPLVSGPARRTLARARRRRSRARGRGARSST
jgi:tetratricopeptide (TPR) repeat protein